MKFGSRQPLRLTSIGALGLATCLIGLLSPAPVMAEAPPRNPAALPFSVHDTNRDGAIDYQEYHQLLQRIESHRWTHGRHPGRHPALLPFTTLDADKNGLVTLDELETGLQQEHRRYRMRRRMSNPHGGPDPGGSGRPQDDVPPERRHK